MRRRWENNSKDDQKTYRAWANMRSRCYRVKDKDYPHYGGRGITVCDRWRDDYDAFVEDMGAAPEGHSLERENNELGYSPENCKWIPQGDQAANRRTSRFVILGGRSLTVADWSRELKIPENTLYSRLDRTGQILNFDL